MAVRVQSEPFDPGAEVAAVTSGRADVGGVATFLGLVRDSFDGVPLVAMTLEHYPGMTERMLGEIEAEARRRWPAVLDVRIVHRYGRLEPGAPIVHVTVAAAHRREAFEACEFLVDWLKTRAPFWKLEETVEGAHWVEAKATDDDAAARWDTAETA
ncbi:MAG: molybdenum cofactor biosynthesis protein MoaE [Azospirillaceae bacterium]